MVLFACRSRTQSMRLYDLFRTNGVSCEIINTPRSIAASCGLSVRVPDGETERAVGICRYYRPDTLIGVYYCDRNGCRRIE